MKTCMAFEVTAIAERIAKAKRANNYSDEKLRMIAHITLDDLATNIATELDTARSIYFDKEKFLELCGPRYQEKLDRLFDRGLTTEELMARQGFEPK